MKEKKTHADDEQVLKYNWFIIGNKNTGSGNKKVSRWCHFSTLVLWLTDSG